MMSLGFQREEATNEILIFVIDESYDRVGDYIDTSQYNSEIAWQAAASSVFLGKLRAEFGADFEEVNVGPGADLPAFVTAISENIVPLIPWIVAAFFSGKPIIDNIGAWRNIFARIKPYSSRLILLNRQGAAVVAVEQIFEEMGGLPKSLKLNGYRVGQRFDEDANSAHLNGQIDYAPPTLNLSVVKHVFEIEADGVTFIVTVDGKDVIARRI